MSAVNLKPFTELSIETECPICYEQMTAGLEHQVNQTWCRFHAECITQWLHNRTITTPNCPICFQKVTHIDGKPFVYELYCYEEAAVQDAVRNGQTEEVRRLLTNRKFSRIFVDLYLGDTVARAAARGNTEIIRLLLARDTISEESRGYSVCEAAYGNHVETVRFLLEGHSISRKLRGWAVYVSAERGHRDPISLLLDGQTISTVDKLSAAWQGIRNGHIGIARLLLAPAEITQAAKGAITAASLAAIAGYMYYAQNPRENLH